LIQAYLGWVVKQIWMKGATFLSSVCS